MLNETLDLLDHYFLIPCPYLDDNATADLSRGLGLILQHLGDDQKARADVDGIGLEGVPADVLGCQEGLQLRVTSLGLIGLHKKLENFILS